MIFTWSVCYDCEDTGLAADTCDGGHGHGGMRVWTLNLAASWMVGSACQSPYPIWRCSRKTTTIGNERLLVIIALERPLMELMKIEFIWNVCRDYVFICDIVFVVINTADSPSSETQFSHLILPTQ